MNSKSILVYSKYVFADFFLISKWQRHTTDSPRTVYWKGAGNSVSFTILPFCMPYKFRNSHPSVERQQKIQIKREMLCESFLVYINLFSLAVMTVCNLFNSLSRPLPRSTQNQTTWIKFLIHETSGPSVVWISTKTAVMQSKARCVNHCTMLILSKFLEYNIHYK